MSETMALSVIAQDPQRSLAFIESIGERLTLGMKGVKNKATGTAVALQMLAEGLTPAQFEQKYHVMDGGGFSLRAEWIHAELMRRGWQVKWLATGEDGKRAAVELSKDGEKHKIEFTIELARKKGLVKPDSNWVKDPAQQLRSKLWGRAATMLAPSIGAGMTDDQEYHIISGSSVAETESVTTATTVNKTTRRGRPKGSRNKSKEEEAAKDAAGKDAGTDAIDSKSSDEQTETALEASREEQPSSELQDGDAAHAVDPDVAKANEEAVRATVKGKELAAATMETKNEIKSMAARYRLNEWIRQTAEQLWGGDLTLNDMSEAQGLQLLVMMHLHVLEMTDKLGVAMEKAGVSDITQLPIDTANEMLGQLRGKLGK
jgi:hypothetical protein